MSLGTILDATVSVVRELSAFTDGNCYRVAELAEMMAGKRWVELLY